MIVYANNEMTANRVAEMMRNEEPEFSRNVQIKKTSTNPALGAFVIFNKTESENRNFINSI